MNLEHLTAIEYQLEDLDQEEIYKTVVDGIRENRIPVSAQHDSAEKILRRLNLMAGDKLKLAAVVLYAKNEALQLAQCTLKLARFNGVDKLGVFIDNQYLHGNAFQLLQEADIFLKRHLPIASYFKADQFKRIDRPAIPVLALREALVNAICHRDYADRGTDISLAIFNDRVDIWNSGFLPVGMTVKDLLGFHDSVLRNKVIANVFYVRGLIERWGTGTNKMVALCKEAGLEEPEFTQRTGGLSVVFRFAVPILPALNIKDTSGLTTRQKEILAVIKEKKAVTIQQIVFELGDLLGKRTIQKELSKLRALNIIDCKGKGKATNWFKI